MCVIIGKFFSDVGWVGVKNRDRNYVPTISFKNIKYKNLEITYFVDEDTKYCEGFNSNGVSILSASLMVSDDEKEIKSKTRTPSKDGSKIKQALTKPTVQEAVDYLISVKLTGHTLVFDDARMFLIEGAWLPKQYHSRNFGHTVRELDQTETVVRTNHGIALEWAGYQRKHDDIPQTMSRASSESRKLIGEYAEATAHTPLDIMNNLLVDYTGNWQLNPTRKPAFNLAMQTTSQTLLMPGNLTMIVRPLTAKLAQNIPEFTKNSVKIIKK